MNNAALDEQKVALTVAVGKCILEWAEVEHHLYALASTLFDEPGLQFKAGTLYRMLDAMISFDAKIKAIDAVVRHNTHDDKLRDVWVKLYKMIRKRAKKRNEIAHSTIVVYEQEKRVFVCPFWSLGSSLDVSKTRLSAKQVTDRAASFRELKDSLNWFFWERDLRAGKIATNIQPKTDLLRRLLVS